MQFHTCLDGNSLIKKINLIYVSNNLTVRVKYSKIATIYLTKINYKKEMSNYDNNRDNHHQHGEKLHNFI